MKRIICIGECSLNIVLGPDGTTYGSMPGGRVTNAAAILAGDDRFKVIMASEVSSDPVGDIMAGYLTDHNVDISSLDRYTEGRTALNVFTAPDAESAPVSLTRYEAYPDEAFDIVWPRVDEGDIVLFGGYYAIDRRMRPRLVRFLNNCAERKAIMIYLPGILPQQEPRITRVMPSILENLELANVVMTRNNDLKLIFGVDNSATCYHDHIDFYCRSLINVDTPCQSISYYTGAEMSSVGIPASTCTTMLWNAGAVAGVVAAIAERGLDATALENPGAEIREAILGAAALSANKAAKSLSHRWQKI